MNSTCTDFRDQYSDYIPVNTQANFLTIPASGLEGFKQTYYRTESFKRNEGSYLKPLVRKHKVHILYGNYVSSEPETRICPKCGCVMHSNGSKVISLKHLPSGGDYVNIEVARIRYRCSSEQCNYSCCFGMPFKSYGHMMTEPLKRFTESLLAYGYTLKETAYLTGLSRNTVKDIDKARLEALYVRTDKDDKRKLIKPEVQAKYLAIDEFKLHDGYLYATHIIDAQTGVVLWIEPGKKKQVVYNFIEHVGLEWMKGVEAVVSDMNSDFEEAFKEKCPHLKIVYDHFHIIKNFNDKVVCEVRKDEQKRLINSGDAEAAKNLKGSKYILTSSKETLRRKDDAASEHKIVSKGSELFNKQTVMQSGNKLKRYQELIDQNQLLFNADWVKSMLDNAYQCYSTEQMTITVNEIIDYCKSTGNKHFLWFARLLENHIDGVVSHATFCLSNGKIEGINRKIKTIRRKSYGLPDDEYFFLKIMDASRQNWKESQS